MFRFVIELIASLLRLLVSSILPRPKIRLDRRLIPPSFDLKDVSLKSVQMLSHDECWAVGYASNSKQSLIMHYQAGAWKLAEVPYPSLSAIRMISPDEGWAVGGQNIIVHYKNGYWQQVSGPDLEFIEGQHYQLLSISMPEPGRGWAVGSEEIIKEYNGRSWKRHQLQILARSALKSISMISAHEGWVATSHGMVHYHDGEWQLESVGEVGDKLMADAVQMLSTDEGWAVGSQILHYKDGRWTRVVDRTTLHALAMVSPAEGWAVGSYVNTATFMHCQNGVWQPVEVGFAPPLHGIHMLSVDEGMAVGDRCTVMRYENGDWMQEYGAVGPSPILVVQMLSADQGWAAGGNGIILQYNHGQWERVSSPIQGPINAIEMLSADEGWIAGGYSSGFILHYLQGRWRLAQQWPSRLADLSMISLQEGWAIADREILRCEAGSWTKVETEALLPVDYRYVNYLNGIDVAPEGSGWAVGNEGIMLQLRSGVWTRMDWPDSDENIISVATLSSEEAWAVSESGNILRYTQGKWQVHTSVKMRLSRIKMLSGGEGWAIGQSGEVPFSISHVLHYKAGAWEEVAVKSETKEAFISDLDILPGEDGWAVGSGKGSAGLLLHYKDGQWQEWKQHI